MTPAGPARSEDTRPTRVTAVINQKGGVGKTALSVGVAAALAEMSKRVLLVDLDPQGHATTEYLGLAESQPDAPSLARALSRMWKGPISDLVVRHPFAAVCPPGTLDVLPTSAAMFDLVRRLDQLRVPVWQLGRVLQFADYEHIVIDCPPALDVLTNNALAIADGLLVPVQLDKTSVRAVRLLAEQVRQLEQSLGREPIEWYGLVPSLYRRPISTYARQALVELQGLGHPMLDHVPQGVVVNEAASRGVPVTTFAPATVQAVAYRKIARVVDLKQPGQAVPVPAEDDGFVFEDFISDVARSRNERDMQNSRRKLYDLLPKKLRH
ncbi:MAG: ParA family protein [Sciscionella sp.]